MAVVTCSGERPVGKKGNLEPDRPVVDTSAILIRNFSFLLTAQIFGVCLGMRTFVMVQLASFGNFRIKWKQLVAPFVAGQIRPQSCNISVLRTGPMREPFQTKMRLLYHRHLDASSDFGLTDSNLFRFFGSWENGATFHGNLRICFQLRHSLEELRRAAAGDNQANGTDCTELIHDV